MNNKKFVVFEYLNGRRFTGKIEEVRNAAFALAKMNSELPVGNNRTDYFKIIEDQIDIINFGEYSDFKTYLLEFINNINNKFSINGFHNLEHVILHGDFNKWNLVFHPSNDEVLGVLDFDNIDCGPRIRDLSEAILSFGAICYKKDSTNFTEEIYSRDNFVYAKEFYKAYNHLSDLSELERCFLPDLIKIVFLELVTLGLIRKDFILNQLLINNIKLFIQDEINVLVEELYNWVK
ncbi:phosphotransferase [Bacillus cytotoxicus]|uniref:phosphotransferase n=1 Tax=Bacillus cytotoxicus TaxID=580165 RepID=UPI003D7D6DF7